MQALAPILHPIPSPSLTRDRPMWIMALGLSRSGTDSLRSALYKLGYSDVYHAFFIQVGQTHDGRFWLPLIWRKIALWRAGKSTVLPDISASDFDRVLGHCEALTDLPCNWFSEELMRAYPDAKIIINRRKDTAAWKKSMKSVSDPLMRDWYLYAVAIFNPRMWWMYWMWYHCSIELYDGSFDLHGERRNTEHYANLHRLCRERNREYIEWEVTEGWEPLCKFLKKDVPDKEFPRGNSRGKEYKDNETKNLAKLYADANRNMAILATLMVTGLGLGLIKAFDWNRTI